MASRTGVAPPPASNELLSVYFSLTPCIDYFSTHHSAFLTRYSCMLLSLWRGNGSHNSQLALSGCRALLAAPGALL